MSLLARAQGLADPHAKVRWAACQALGQLCTDLGPELQQDEHARILPGLMAVMGDFSQPRVQAHAAAAVVNFSEHCEQARCPSRACARCALGHTPMFVFVSQGTTGACHGRLVDIVR